MSELCAYGCGLPGLFRHAKKGTPRCSENISNCPAIKAEKIKKRAAHEAKRKAEKAEFLANPEPCSKCGRAGVFFNDRTKKWSCTIGKTKCPASVQKYNDTMMDRYQTTTMAHIEGVQEKRSEILKKQHEERGEEGRKAIDLKRQETMYERTGYRNIGQVPENKIRVAEGNQEKFGYRNTLQVPEFREKGKQTMLNTIGVDHPLKSPEIRENMKKTCQVTYGTDNPMQNAVIFSKSREHAFARHEYVFPSGRIAWIQGFEAITINHLLELGFPEDDLIIDQPVIPTIRYFLNGKSKSHFPDLFIQSQNHIIETKSDWTYAKDFEKLKEAQIVAKSLGYKYTVVICDKKKVVEMEGDLI